MSDKKPLNMVEPMLQQLADQVDENDGAPLLYQFQRNGKTYVLETYTCLDFVIRTNNNLGEVN